MPVRSSIEEIAEYKPGRLVEGAGAIKLSSNENPLGPSPEVVRVIIDSLEVDRLKLSIYPRKRDEVELRAAIAGYLGASTDTDTDTDIDIDPESIVIGAGIDGVLDTIVKIFISAVNGDEAVIPVPTFSLYETLVKIAGGTPRYITRRRDADFDIPLTKLIAACNEKTRLIFIASPNNPTGNCIAESDVRALAESVAGTTMVVIDEAYVEFAGADADADASSNVNVSSTSLVNLVNEYENLLVLRTFSKAFGLAGLRIGYAVIPEWLVSVYNKVAIPFSVNNLGLKAAAAALKDKVHLRRSISVVKSGRAFLTQNLRGLFTVYPSQANFLLLDVAPKRSYEVCDALEEYGIAVRDCSSFRGAGDSLVRISVGTREQNAKVVAALKGIG